jgi:hypothetical protein
VDALDYAILDACTSGPGIPNAADCGNADLDLDGDVDQSDFGIFQRCYSGESISPDPSCAN